MGGTKLWLECFIDLNKQLRLYHRMAQISLYKDMAQKGVRSV